MRSASIRIGLPAAAAVVVVAGLLYLALERSAMWGAAARPFAPRLVIERVFPGFDPTEAHYVARCGRGRPILVRPGRGVSVRIGSGPARTGRVEAGRRVEPGDNFLVIATSDGRSRTYSVRCLPRDFPQWRFKRFRTLGDGLFTVSFKPSRRARHWVVVFDHRGAPRWWYRPRTAVLWAQVLRDGTIAWARAFGDGYGQDRRMAFEVRSSTGKLKRLVRTRGSIIDGHEFREAGPGRVLVATYVPERADLRRVGGPRRAAVVAAAIRELDRRGRSRWGWSSRGRIGLEETGRRWWARVLANPRRRIGGLRTFDPVHINAIDLRGTRQLVISARHTDGVYGIDRASERVAWKLGGRRTDRSLTIVGDPARRHFGGQHDSRVAGDGVISVYDNGRLRDHRPRVVFYRLHPERREARYVDQLNDATVRESHCCGSARQLRDGGWLVNWGSTPLVTGFDRAGRPAFRLRLPGPAYRAVPVPAGAVTVAALDRGLERMRRR